MAFDLCGGHLALDFANTLGDRHGDAPVERLPAYGDLLAFAQQSGVVSAARARALAAAARRAPARAEAVRRDAVALREAIYALFAAVVAGDPPDPADLAVLNRHVARQRVTPELRMGWEIAPDELDAPLGPIVCDAVELLTGPQRARVSRCASDTCRWLFLDTSKNHSRRWCDMKQCGNRHKARRFQERQRDG